MIKCFITNSVNTRFSYWNPVLDSIPLNCEVEVLIVMITQSVFNISRVDITQPVSTFTFSKLACDIDWHVEEAWLSFKPVNQCVLCESYVFLTEFDLLSFFETINIKCIREFELRSKLLLKFTCIQCKFLLRFNLLLCSSKFWTREIEILVTSVKISELLPIDAK